MSAVLSWAITALVFALIVIGVCVFAGCEGGNSKLAHIGEIVGGIVVILLALAIMIL